MGKKIGALVVLYEPEYSLVMKMLDALSDQVDILCLVDNSRTTHEEWFDSLASSIYVPNNDNLGIAAAQNIGIRILMENGCSHILFSDQDSIASDNTVSSLYSAASELQNSGISLATVGTVAINRRIGKKIPKRSISKGYVKVGERKFEEVDYVRCSMSLTPVKSLETVGMMDEKLFIDGVDSEWCWRASRYGLRTFLVDDAVIYHSLGQSDRRIGNKEITIPSSTRMYYQYRNFFDLSSRPYVPFCWKFKNGVKYLLKIPYYTITCKNGIVNIRHIFKGIKAGINEKYKGI